MITAFVQLQINGVLFDAIFTQGERLNCGISYFKILGDDYPLIGAFVRPEIYKEWIKQEWFKQAVPDFKVIRGQLV